MINVLKNNKGEATYIYLCILVLVLSMLLSVLILYMGLRYRRSLHHSHKQRRWIRR